MTPCDPLGLADFIGKGSFAWDRVPLGGTVGNLRARVSGVTLCDPLGLADFCGISVVGSVVFLWSNSANFPLIVTKF